MGTYAKAETPLTMTRGRAWSKAMTYTTEAGAPVDLTGFIFTARLTWRGVEKPASVAVTDAAAGAFRVSVLAADTAALPIGVLAELHIAATDALDDPSDWILPINGEAA